MVMTHEPLHLPSSETTYLAHFYLRRLKAMERAANWFLAGLSLQTLPLLDRLSCWSVATETWSPQPITVLPWLSDAITLTCLAIGCLTLMSAPRTRR